MPYGNEEDINKRIAEVEFKMQTEHMPLKEEKKLLAEIQELKRNRPKVHQLINLENAIASDDKVIPLKDKLKALIDIMSHLYDQKRNVSTKLKELNESRKKTTGGLPDLIENRDAISK